MELCLGSFEAEAFGILANITVMLGGLEYSEAVTGP
jgi:hypothetical protein